MPAISVGTARMAAHAEIFRISSFWRTDTWVRFASRMLVSNSRYESAVCVVRTRWS